MCTKIPDHVKEQVKKAVLKDLEEYFQEAEGNEDESVMVETDPVQRVEDFYLYQQFDKEE